MINGLWFIKLTGSFIDIQTLPDDVEREASP
jgi:hypothetical protein